MVATRIEIRLLGDVAVTDGRTDCTPRGAKQRVLVALLALNGGEAVSPDHLAAALWGDNAPSRPANALQAQVSALRKVLPEGAIRTHPTGYSMACSPADVDALVFERELAEGRDLLAAGRPADASARLRRALDRWNGPALSGMDDVEALRAAAVRLDEQRLVATELRIDADLALGRHALLPAELEELCAAHPLREHLWAQRMVVLYRCGRQAEALRVYAEVRELLADQLGLEPGPELRDAEAMVLAHDDRLAAPAGTSTRRGNLLPRLSSFVGRERELEHLTDAVRSHRLVTLTGSGGAGKTRLAVEVAERVEPEFPDGSWIVELAPVGEHGDVATAVSAVLEEIASGSMTGPSPTDPTSSRSDLLEALANGRMLIVLDNCEHVIEVAAETGLDLLRRIPGLHVLATSREPLRVHGEVVVAVPPLAPDDAAALFVDRARATGALGDLQSRDAPVVAEICDRLDGMPLAIELAASRARAFSPAQICDRLDDRFRLLTGGERTALPRQQTLRAVVAWSHDLLFADEQRLFARLSVFAAPVPLDAVTAVCADELLSSDDVLDRIGRLVDKSLVTCTHPSRQPEGGDSVLFGQLQTLRLYARERLAESGDADAVRARHAEWYASVASAASRGLPGKEGATWRRRLAREHDDLHAAMSWFAAQGDGTRAVRLVTDIAWWWFLRAEWTEMLRWVDEALAVAECDPVQRALGQQWRAYFASFVDPAAARADEALAAFAVLRSQPDRGTMESATLLCASTLNRVGRYADALDVLVALPRQASGPAPASTWNAAMAQLLTANAQLRLGDEGGAENAALASLECFAAVGEEMAAVEARGVLAQVAARRGDLATALDRYGSLIDDCRRRDLPAYLAYWLLGRGVTWLRLGEPSAAEADFVEAIDAARHPANRAIALIGRARAGAHAGRPTDGLAGLEQAGVLVDGMAVRWGPATAAVALGLQHLDLGDRERAQAQLARLVDDDTGASCILAAALALHDGDTADAAAFLDRWPRAAHDGAGGFLTALLGHEHAILAGALAQHPG